MIDPPVRTVTQEGRLGVRMGLILAHWPGGWTVAKGRGGPYSS